jgi:hypothetical protein
MRQTNFKATKDLKSVWTNVTSDSFASMTLQIFKVITKLFSKNIYFDGGTQWKW